MKTTIGIFDFDMTTAVTVAKETPSLSQFRDVEYATTDILNARPTKLTSRMMQYKGLYILTARDSGRGAMRKAMQRFFLHHGVYVPSSNIIMVGDYSGETHIKKSVMLTRLAKRYGRVDFFDDDSRNVEVASKISGVRSHEA